MTEIIFDVYYVFDLCERVNGENIRIKSGWIFFIRRDERIQIFRSHNKVVNQRLWILKYSCYRNALYFFVYCLTTLKLGAFFYN
jgi:hypothetical protein